MNHGRFAFTFPSRPEHFWLVAHFPLTPKFICKMHPPPQKKSLSEIPPPTINVSFEMLGPEGYVTPQSLRNGQRYGGRQYICIGQLWVDIYGFKYIEPKLIST